MALERVTVEANSVEKKATATVPVAGEVEMKLFATPGTNGKDDKEEFVVIKKGIKQRGRAAFDGDAKQIAHLFNSDSDGTPVLVELFDYMVEQIGDDLNATEVLKNVDALALRADELRQELVESESTDEDEGESEDKGEGDKE